ncbi:MAG: bifunctional nicotinamidase/pyrazinamidase [Paracoccaceae bacterium]|nr:bifunctional nicotinamidase/pyrazinamidase [Paracoccaceae bacterium]MDE2673767.1 bifunctional nicotinamidase/pyrazinamidase [Paracoccaceae bacterium]MXZ51269.1 bifunctional nicotinamidase/pyrazinamidase [Paracoccaceae bacterium]MYF46032.1 bifunctional nicotinamidase/pyrazinamidase [Paracoccaceae bacterium]MYI92449.1 bifunctional nicotinamidase/pyrazinamidase [Paracoccaceae bacterium]
MGNQTDAVFLVIDVQNDFCPGGALAVPDGDQIIKPINKLLPRFPATVFTQDWHPEAHSSFASNHKDKSVYELISLSYGKQVLWPDHCVQGTKGAEFHKDLQTDHADLIIRKGFRKEIDSYSAFFENDRKTATGLDGYLKNRNMKKIICAGLATDFCVYYSAIDARKLGYQVTVLMDASRAIDLDGSLDNALNDMRANDIVLSTTAELLS